MKPLPVLAVLAVLSFWMILYSVTRIREIRTDAKAVRFQQKPRAQVVPPDPSRFSGLTIAPQGKDDALMVLLPAGKFIRGTDEPIGNFDERPSREVTLLSYSIDLYEVSNKHYQAFVAKTDRPRQEVMVFYDDVAYLLEPDLPAVGVSWFDAQAYCQWNGKRLPTEAEWEYAAGGNGLGQWPWGSTYQEGYANVREGEDGFAYSAPVGSYEAGRSVFGLYDMSGNVAEWVFDWYDEFFYRDGQVTVPSGPSEAPTNTKVVRGGSWNDIPHDTRTTKRFPVAPHRKEATIGFRCAMDALS